MDEIMCHLDKYHIVPDINCWASVDSDCIHSLIDACCNYVKSLEVSLAQSTLARGTPASPVRTVMRLAGRIVNIIVRRLGFKVVRYEQSLYSVNPSEKFWSLRFLVYVLSNNTSLPLTLFDDVASRHEVLKFVRNKVLCSVLDQIPQHLIFDSIDLKYCELYQRMWRSVVNMGDHYVLFLRGRRYKLPVNHFEAVVFLHRYGLDQLPRHIVELISGRDVIDVGAFIGDSLLVLNELRPRRIYAIEPTPPITSLLKRTLQLNNVDNVVTVSKAISDRRGSAKMVYAGSASFITSGDGGVTVETTTIDNLVHEHDIDVALIKMDIEGTELAAVRGALNTIRKFKPVLLISLYHEPQDFFEIPKLIKGLVPEYKIKFLNLNRCSPTQERVLLAYIN